MTDTNNSLESSYNFSIKRETKTHYYEMHTQFIQMGFDGKRNRTENYLLKLSNAPKEVAKTKFDVITCKEFGLKIDDEAMQMIPALKDWSYNFDPTSNDGKGVVFGIPHNVFTTLVNDKKEAIIPDFSYPIYNSFVDFHALSDLFTMPFTGIDELHKIGDKITHKASYTKPSVQVGDMVEEGSYFQNGKIALEFKGLSIVDGQPCAIITYDSGESTFLTKVRSTNGTKITSGGSEYIGDIYLDLNTRWVKKVTLNENVITQKSLKNEDRKQKGYTVRHLEIRMIDEAAFNTDKLDILIK